MKALFLGDSITEGVGASSVEKRYTDLVAKKLGIRAVNYGLRGTRIARQKRTSQNTIWDIDFRLRVQLMEEDCDLVFVFGGTNDYGHGALHLGSPDVYDECTFATQLGLLIDTLCEKYGKEKLCFLLPLHRCIEEPMPCKGEGGDETGAPLSEYVRCMRSTLERRGIDYIDLYENGFPRPATRDGDEYTADGLHPNDKGHALVADRVSEYIKKR